MNFNEIVTKEDYEIYISHIVSLNDSDRFSEFENVVKCGVTYGDNQYQNAILDYFKNWLMNEYWIDDSNSIDQIHHINDLKEIIKTLLDQTLDSLKYCTEEEKKAAYDLLDDMNISIDECDKLNNLYYQKIINNNDNE